MPKTASECQLCIKERVKAGLAPNLLHTMPRARKVDGKGRVCPECDYGAFDLSQRTV